jgi:hypothetical protein
MGRTDTPDDKRYRYKLRLTVEQTEASRPSILVNRLKLFEADSLQSPEIGALADFSRAHAQMSEKDRYVLAFSLMTVRQLLGRASKVSPKFDQLRAYLDDIDREVMA